MSDRKPDTLFSCPNICWMIAVVLGFAAFMVAISSMGQGAIISMLVGIVVFFVAGWLLGKILCTATEAETQKPVETPSPKASEESLAAPTVTAKVEEAAPVSEATPEVQETVVSEDLSEVKPRTMKAARKAGADDLKRLKGVGPKLEQTLNDLGFFHFDQVAKWTPQEIAWVDARLKFKGRIERDGWIEQAKILADGGETEFSKRGKKA